MRSKKAFFIPLFIGLIGLAALLRNPRFESIRAVDALRLLGSGACFGVALAGLFGMFRDRSGR